MDKTTLVKEDEINGEELIKRLDDHGFPVDAAFWLYSTDSGVWRLMIASQVVDQKGPKGAYHLVQTVLAKMPPDFGISLHNITMLSPKADLVKLFRSVIHTGPKAISRIRFTRNAINNTFIEDAYIYRVH